MSYYEQNQSSQAPARPGFSEQTSGSFQSGGFSQGAPAPAPAPQDPQAQYQSSGYNQNAYSTPAQQNQAPANSNYGGGQSQGNYGGNGGYNRGGGGGGGYNRGNGGGFKGGGGGFKGGGGFQRAPLTPEQLQNLKLPKSAVLAGNNNAPDALVPLIREIADILKRHGFEIRASTMDGFDKMVMDNVQGLELHTPWKGFNQIENVASSFNSDECKEYAKRYLPEWGSMKEGLQPMYAKNARLVLGKTVKQPCQVVIVWSEDGVEGPQNRAQRSGHAGHIAAIAHAMNIPVINLSNPDPIQRLRRILGE